MFVTVLVVAARQLLLAAVDGYEALLGVPDGATPVPNCPGGDRDAAVGHADVSPGYAYTTFSDNGVDMAARFRLFLLFALIMIAGPERASAAELGQPPDYHLTTWGEAEGLPPGRIWSLAQDAEGYLWLGTDRGAYRFDGVQFLSQPELGYERPPGPAYALLASTDGSVWIGAGPGYVARLESGHLRSFGADDGLDLGFTRVLVEDHTGTIWAGTTLGLYYFRDNSWARWDTGLPRSGVHSAFVDTRGNLYVATAFGIFRKGPQQEWFATVVSSPRDEDEEDQDFLRAFGGPLRGFTEDAEGEVWVTDPSSGFRPLQQPGWNTGTGSEQLGQGTAILHDQKGNLWVGTKTQGVWRLSSDAVGGERVLRRATRPTTVLKDGIWSLLEDRDHNIWIGTLDGLQRLSPATVTALTGLGLVTGVEATPDGSVWAATPTSLLRFSNGLEDTPFALPVALRSFVRMHVDHTGVLWVATSDALIRIAGDVATIEQLPDVPRQLNLLTSDRRGGIWLYDLLAGVVRWNRGTLERFRRPEPTRGTRVYAMQTDRNHQLWLSANTGAVAVIKTDSPAEVLSPDAGLDAGVYRLIHESRDGTLWFGGTEGLSWFADGEFETLHRDRGFPLDSVSAIVDDDAGDLWLGTSAGIAHIRRETLDAATSRESRESDWVPYSIYDRSDGVSGTPRWFGVRAAARATDGRLWFVTSLGLAVVDPKLLVGVSPPPAVRVAAVVADGATLRPPAPMRFSSDLRKLELMFEAATLESPAKARFRYRLEGFEEDWVESGRARRAVYTNLSPGRYRFHVAAGNTEGQWHEAASFLTVTIDPAFYESWWFVVASCIGVAFGLVGAWRWRTREAERKFSLVLDERTRLGREIHDTLLQDLVGIALRCEVVAMEVDPTTVADTKTELARLRHDIDGYIRETRDAIWRLRAAPQDHDLATMIRCAGEAATTNQSQSFELAVHGTVRKSSASVKEELLRIAQEAISNAVRHAQATDIRAELRYEATTVVLQISDNGIGFDLRVAAQGSNLHLGLQGMRERAESIGARYHIATSAEQGTCIEVEAPNR